MTPLRALPPLAASAALLALPAQAPAADDCLPGADGLLRGGRAGGADARSGSPRARPRPGVRLPGKRDVLENDGTIKKWFLEAYGGGRAGQVRFIRDHYEEGPGFSMGAVFRDFRDIVGARALQRLGWRPFDGTTEDFRWFEWALLEADGRIKRGFYGQEGYVAFTKLVERRLGARGRLADGGTISMATVFNNASAVLGGDLALGRLLRWRPFRGTREDLAWYAGTLVVAGGRADGRFAGRRGHVAFARAVEERLGGRGELAAGKRVSMMMIFKNAAAALGGDEAVRRLLGWRPFRGSPEDLEWYAGALLGADGTVGRDFAGQEGCVAFTRLVETRLRGGAKVNVMTVVHNAAAVLGGDEEVGRLLGWRPFNGTTEEFEWYAGTLLAEDGTVKEGFAGQRGYAAFAGLLERRLGERGELADGKRVNMLRVFDNAVALLGGHGPLRRQLKWRPYDGTLGRFRAERGALLARGADGELVHKGMAGQAGRAMVGRGGGPSAGMSRTRQEVLAVLDKDELEDELGWPPFPGTPLDLVKLAEIVLGTPAGDPALVNAALRRVDAALRAPGGPVAAKAFLEKHGSQEGQADLHDLLGGLLQSRPRNMEGTHARVSALLGGADAMRAAGLGAWTSFNGTSGEQRALVALFARLRATDPGRLMGEDGLALVAGELGWGRQRTRDVVSSQRRLLLAGDDRPLGRSLGWPSPRARAQDAGKAKDAFDLGEQPWRR